MRVLVVGGGGREHALCRAIIGSPRLTRLWCAPGNPGIVEDGADCVPIAAEAVDALVAFARDHAIDLVVPGPEAPLMLGLADRCAEAGIACTGPSAAAARIEGSKAFMKDVARAAGVAGARAAVFDDAAAARRHVRAVGAPIVVKADGLAAGKGVVVAGSVAEALAAIEALGALGEAGATLVIEECLHGEEVSVFALCDGTHAIPFGAAADHKRVGEGDQGPNTGGMGAFAPPPALTSALHAAVLDGMIRPTLAELARRGTPFRGILFAGVMLTADGPRLLEFNARLGDPECQALLTLLDEDLLPLLHAAAVGDLRGHAPRWRAAHSLAVVLCARGYPGAPARGGRIDGLTHAARVPGVQVFQAATARDDQGALIAAGGRVLNVVGTGDTLAAARTAAYAAVDRIEWADGFCRRDIGLRA